MKCSTGAAIKTVSFTLETSAGTLTNAKVMATNMPRSVG